MERSIVKFVFLFLIFSIGLFLGEWLLDIVLNSARDSFRVEARQSATIGFIVALLMVLNTSLPKKSK
jgi:hypothetical protein